MQEPWAACEKPGSPGTVLLERWWVGAMRGRAGPAKVPDTQMKPPWTLQISLSTSWIPLSCHLEHKDAQLSSTQILDPQNQET